MRGANFRRRSRSHGRSGFPVEAGRGVPAETRLKRQSLCHSKFYKAKGTTRIRRAVPTGLRRKTARNRDIQKGCGRRLENFGCQEHSFARKEVRSTSHLAPSLASSSVFFRCPISNDEKIDQFASILADDRVVFRSEYGFHFGRLCPVRVRIFC